ncbi:MAG TPA: TonB-dependent receptor [Gammaproteobacteria bacterium]
MNSIMRVNIQVKGLSRALRVACCGLLLSPGVLLGQTAPDGEDAGLEEIIVEATRLGRNLDRVPGAVSVIGQDEIQLGRQQLGLDEALNRVPGLFMQGRYNFSRDLSLSIRGFGARAGFGIRGVKILVDGIPETLPDGQGQVDTIDLGTTRQIEVIRGPSSSLYGNASGGVVNVVSEGGPETPFASASLATGAYDYRKMQVKTGGQAGPMDYLVSLSDSEIDGYRAQSEWENLQFNGRFNFDLGADSSLLAVVNYTDQPVANDAGGISAVQAAEDPRSAWTANETFDAGETLEQSRLGLVYTLPLGESHELSARSYYVWRDFTNKLPFQDGGAGAIDRFFAGGGLSYTYSGMLAGRTNRLIVGFDLDDQDDDRRRFDNLSGTFGDLTFDQNERVTSRGLFVQNELGLSDNIDLSFGLRFDEVEFGAEDRFLDDGDDSGSRTLDDVSPMLGIVTRLSPNLSVYGTVSTAFETPTTTEFANPSGAGGFNPNVDPQSATNLEIGLRGLIGQSSRYELAVFSIEVEDELVPFELAESPNRTFYANAGESDRLGVEFSIRAELLRHLTGLLSYTYSDFTFNRFIDDDGNDFSGNTIPGTPEHVLFGELSYNHPSGWFGALDLLHVDDLFTDNANSAVSPSYTLSNLRLGFETSVGSLVVAPYLGINNLTDEAYYANVRINVPFGGRFFEPGPERNAYAGVELRFDFR